MGKFAELYRQRTPRNIYGDGERKGRQDAATVQKTMRRMKYLFPSLWKNDTKYNSESDFFDTKQIKDYLTERIKEKLDALTLDEIKYLMKRENEVQLCVALGMNERYAELRCHAVASMMQEMGIPGKMNMIDSIQSLIWGLDIEKPFGEEIDEDTVKQTEWLTYKSFELKRGQMKKGMAKTLEFLESEGLQNGHMFGTTSSTLKSIFDHKGFVYYAKETNLSGQPDFGAGIYTFKEMHHALSFAFDQCFLFEEHGKRDNPAIVVLPNLERYATKQKMGFVDVHSKRFFTEEELQRKLRFRQRYEHLHAARKRWSMETARDKNWKEFLKIGRGSNLFPDRRNVYYGVMHDQSLTKATNMGDDPVADQDGWIQYCLSRVHGRHCRVGDTKLFLEFQIDFSEWCDPAAIEQVQLQMEKDASEIWHNQKQQAMVDAERRQQERSDRIRAAIDAEFEEAIDHISKTSSNPQEN